MRLKSGIAMWIASILVMLFGMAPSLRADTSSALVYKNYVVRQDQGQDILCDPCVVQKHDFILKLFRESGEISHTDFPEFLNIFSRINDHIPNINLIQPGQRIYIPLKKITPESMPGQNSGVVTLPFMNISSLSEQLKSFASEYFVQKGDKVSLLLSRSFGRMGTRTYKEASQIFQMLNPVISNPDLVKAGQTVWLPHPSLREQPWYTSLFDEEGKLLSQENLDLGHRVSPAQPSPSAGNTPLEKAANILNAKVFNKGIYYFPRVNSTDLELDLSLFPILEFLDKNRVIVIPPPSSAKPTLLETDIADIRSFWKSLSTLPVDPDAPVDDILEAFFKSDLNKNRDNVVSFSDKGVQVTVRARWWLNEPIVTNKSSNALPKKVGLISFMDPESGNTPTVLAYLANHGIILKDYKDEGNVPPQKRNAPVLLPPVIPSAPPEALVTALTTVFGLAYSPNVGISFPYGGIQIPAVTNLLTTVDGMLLFVDYGNLYGDAIEAIEKSGISVVQITHHSNYEDSILKLLSATGHSYERKPVLMAAKAPGGYGVEISIPGFLVTSRGGVKTLLSQNVLDRTLIQFINGRGIKIVQLENRSG